jgi:hypothetical protein
MSCSRLLTLVSTLAALLPCLATAGEVRLLTTGGGVLNGDILHLDQTTLTIGINNTTPRRQVVIPIETIESMELTKNEALLLDPTSFLHLAPLFQYASPALAADLMRAATVLAEKERWITCQTWLDALEILPLGEADRAALTLIRAQALHALGLNSALQQILAALNEHFPPLLAPLSLCLLNAKSRRDNGQIEAARFWATLPGLRLPVQSDPHLDRLLQSLTPLANGPPSAIHPNLLHPCP